MHSCRTSHRRERKREPSKEELPVLRGHQSQGEAMEEPWHVVRGLQRLQGHGPLPRKEPAGGLRSVRQARRDYGAHDHRRHPKFMGTTTGGEVSKTKKRKYVPKDHAPGDTSDGYHTFNELYEHRTGLLMAFCNVLAEFLRTEGLGEDAIRRKVYKSWEHHDGDMYDGMFIVGVNCRMTGLPDRWATWHCEAKWWNLFEVPELKRAPEWDGHTPEDALARLVAVCTRPRKPAEANARA